jgi:hypothetical protein
VFLSSFDTDWNLQWVNAWGGELADHGYDLELDIWEHVICGGAYSDTVDFDGGPGVVERTSEGVTDSYIVRYPKDGTW